MSAKNKQRETFNHHSDKTPTPLDKWFYTYELIYACVCALCKFASPIKGASATILMSVLSGISAVLIIVTIVKRIAHKQHGYAASIGVLAFFTVMVIKWCIAGEF